MAESQSMPFSGLDAAAVSRALSLLAERPGDIVDALFERSERLEVPPEGEPPGIRSWRECGLAVRLVREGEQWLATRDGFSKDALRDAVRRVARAYPRTAFPLPDLSLITADSKEEAIESEALLRFPSQLASALRRRRVAFPLRLTVRQHRREIQVIGSRVVPPFQTETFISLRMETPWHRQGALYSGSPVDLLEPVADRLVAGFASRESPPPTAGPTSLVLGSHAAAILLHEGIAHALEADTLALTGFPEAALGLELASKLVSVVDDPGAAPEGVRRECDDEGMPVLRRFLVREGVVDQILADRYHSEQSDRLEPGAGRRSSRHEAPGPRSTYLELLPGSGTLDELVDGVSVGLYASEARSGSLDPRTGTLILSFPFARRIEGGRLTDPVGPFSIRAQVADLLARVVAVGGESRREGAGWCAKGGQLLPVWASSPPLVIEAVEVVA